MRVVAAALYIVLSIFSLGIQGNVQAYPTISFKVVGATEASYRDFLGALREIVSRGTKTVNGLPVLKTAANVPDRDRFVLVNLIDRNTVTLGIDVVNLYVVAFTSANGQSYFFKDATTLELKNLFVGTKQKKLSYTSNYDILENKSKRREKIPLGPTPLANAITGLWKGENVARSVLVVIQMVSEAARFKRIEEQVRKSITNRNTFTPQGLIVSMENEWGAMSKQVQLSKDGENFINSVQLQYDNYQPLIVKDFTTLSRYTMIAILLDKGSKTTSSSYSNIALAEDFLINELL